jgi:hypothetical protein
MHPITRIAVTLLLALLSKAVFAVTDSRVFAYAEANYPNLFNGNPAAGQYQQYNYRYYQASDCYLAVDTAGVIFMLGSCTGGELTAVGPVSAFADTITAWEATQTTNPSGSDYSGTWTGSYSVLTVSYIITQRGSNLTLRSVPTLLTAEQTYTGTINGDSATISTTDYATATATLTAIDSSTVKVVQESCTPNRTENAIYCFVPTGTAITFKRQ